MRNVYIWVIWIHLEQLFSMWCFWHKESVKQNARTWIYIIFILVFQSSYYYSVRTLMCCVAVRVTVEQLNVCQEGAFIARWLNIKQSPSVKFVMKLICDTLIVILIQWLWQILATFWIANTIWIINESQIDINKI